MSATAGGFLQGNEWTEWFAGVEEGLGVLYRQMLETLDLSNDVEAEADAFAFRKYVRTLPREGKKERVCRWGLYLEPECFDANNSPTGSRVLLELSYALHGQSGEIQETQLRTGSILGRLVDAVSSEFRLENPVQKYPNYPNQPPRPLAQPIFMLGREGRIPVLWLTLAVPVGERLRPKPNQPLAPCVWDARLAAEALRPSLAKFLEVIRYARGWLAADGVRDLTPPELVGWCGEFAFWAGPGNAERYRWRGGLSRWDFEGNNEVVEVKTSVTGLPVTAWFSVGELRLAFWPEGGQKHGLVRVSLRMDNTRLESGVTVLEDILEGKARCAWCRDAKEAIPKDNAWMDSLVRTFGLELQHLAAHSECLGAFLREVCESADFQPTPELDVFQAPQFEPLKSVIESNCWVDGRVCVNLFPGQSGA